MALPEDEQIIQDEPWVIFYHRALDLMVVNLVWILFSVPVITAVPALGGLFYATNQIAHGGGADWRQFGEGFRRCFWLSWRWSLINAVMLGLLGLSAWFYGHFDSPWLAGLQVLFTVLAAAWGVLQLFTFPLLLEQADQRFIVALRNSVVILLRWPVIAWSAVLQIAVVTAISVFLFLPGWAFISASLCAYCANRAVVTALQKAALHPVQNS